MKILFIQLSDLHFQSSIKIDGSVVEKMLEQIKGIGEFEKCYLVISGDIANSGNTNEYKKAKILIGNIVHKLKNTYPNIGYVPVFIVPGNHDINFENKPRDRSEVVSLIKNKKIQEKIDDELTKFDSFYEFANQNKCFINNKIIDNIYESVYDYQIQFNLINSELFSTYKDSINDDDKGTHYLPPYEIEKIKRKDTADLVVTIAHRNYEWFDWEASNKYKEYITQYSDILFVGHQHINYIDKLNNTVVCSVRFFDFEKYSFSFSTLVYDADTKKYKGQIYDWDDSKGFFSKYKEKDGKLDGNGKYSIIPNYDFTHALDTDERDMSIKSYYVFPGVEETINEEKGIIKEIIDWKSFVYRIKENKYVIIEGKSLSGKTALLKQIYIELQKEFIPLFISIDDINIKNIDKIIKQLDNLVRSSFFDQYEDSKSFERYLLLDKSKKIVIIDDYDKIKPKYFETINNYLVDKFDHIIVSTNSQYKTSIMQNIKEKYYVINKNEDVLKLSLMPFVSNKRKELIKRYFDANNLDSSSNAKQINSLNNFIKNQLNIFDLNPAFIIMYLNYCIQIRDLDSNSNIFGKVFENNLVNAIRKGATDSNLEEYSVILEEIAYYIHFNKRYPISINEISSIITSYNNEFGMNVNCHGFLSVMVDSRILKDDDNNYKFISNSVLAYFVAKCLNSKIQNELGKDELSSIINNIYLNINGDILLFLSYISNNYNILENLKDVTINHMESWEEFSFDNEKIAFISSDTKEFTINLPSEEDREKQENKDRQNEKKVIKNNDDSIVYNLYEEEGDKDRDEIELLKAFTYTNLIAKILPNFNHRLRKEQKDVYIDLIFRYPNKILFKVLLYIDSQYAYIVDYLYEFFKNIGYDNMSKEKIKKEINLEAELLILNVLSHYSILGTSEKTIYFLTNYANTSTNHLIQKMIMHHHLGNFDEFSSIAIKLYDKSKKPMIKSMVKRVAFRHFLLNKDLKIVGKVAAFSHKFFNTSDKMKLIK